jgi:hypothetical protein
MKYHEISWNIMKYYEISWNIMKYHEISWNIVKYHELLVRAFGTDLSNLSQTCHLPHFGCSRRRCHLLAASRRLCEEAQQRAMKQQARRSAAHNMAQHWAPFLSHFMYSNNSVILTFQSHHHIRSRHATFPSLIAKNYWLPLPIAWKKRISLSSHWAHVCKTEARKFKLNAEFRTTVESVELL